MADLSITASTKHGIGSASSSWRKRSFSAKSAFVLLHVCETHAGWYGVSAEDFPDYVDVAPTGPGQVSLYQELGYDLIVIE